MSPPAGISAITSFINLLLVLLLPLVLVLRDMLMNKYASKSSVKLPEIQSKTFAAVVLLLLTFLFSLPVPFHLSDRLIGGGGDAWQFPWNNFAFRQEILQGHTPYYTNLIYFPEGTSLALHSYTELNSAIGLLFSPFFNDIAQTNLEILISTFLSALGMWLLARELTGNSIASLFAAIAFAFCPFRMGRMAGQVNFATTQAIPFALWSFLRFAKTKKFRYAAALGIFFALAHYSNQYFSVYLLIILSVITIIGLLLFPEWRNIKFIGGILFSALLALSFLAPALIQYGRDLKSGALWSPEKGSPAGNIAMNLSQYVHVGVMNPWIADLLPEKYAYDRYARLAPGLIPLITGIAGLLIGIRKREKVLIPLAAVCIVFMLLSLGPETTLWGHDVPMPYSLLQMIPFVNHVRIPTRFAVIPALCFALFSAFAINALWQSGNRRSKVLGTILFLLLLIELSPVPVFQQPLDSPEVFQKIAASRTSTMLTFPYRFDGIASLQIAHQIVHHQNLFNGRISRVPIKQVDFATSAPVLRVFERLSSGKGVPDPMMERDIQLAPYFRSIFNVRYVSVFPPYSKIKGSQDLIHNFFPDAKLLSEDQDILVFELPEVTENSYDMRGRDEAMRFFLYDNWDVSEFNGRNLFVCDQNNGTFLLPTIKRDQRLQMEMRLRTESKEGRCAILLRNKQIQEGPLDKNGRRISITLTGKEIFESHNLLKINFENTGPVALQVLKFTIL